MIKAELVRGIITEGMEFKTKKEEKEFAEAKIQEINDLVEKIGATLEVGDKAKLGDLEISKKLVPAKSGEMNGKKWETPEKVIVKVKLDK